MKTANLVFYIGEAFGDILNTIISMYTRVNNIIYKSSNSKITIQTLLNQSQNLILKKNNKIRKRATIK